MASTFHPGRNNGTCSSPLGFAVHLRSNVSMSSSPATTTTSAAVKSFLDEVMFEKYDTVLTYDRGRGFEPRSAENWGSG
jgi:hypothetical protein